MTIFLVMVQHTKHSSDVVWDNKAYYTREEAQKVYMELIRPHYNFRKIYIESVTLKEGTSTGWADHAKQMRQ